MLAYANTQAKANNAYRQNTALTASPGELTLMLYEGCLKNLKLAKRYVSEDRKEAAHENFQKAQAIISELERTLDMQYDVSKQLFSLYRYLLAEMAQANIKKDVHKEESMDKTDMLMEIVTDLRDTWQQAVRLYRQQSTTTGG